MITRAVLVYGTIAGLIVGLPLFVLTVTTRGEPPQGVLLGYTIMLVALSAVFAAIKRHRDTVGGGVIGFWTALALGLGVSLVASLFYVAAWEAALAVTGLDFGQAYADALIAREKAKGLTGEALDHFIAEMEAFKRDYADPRQRLPMTFTEIFPVGVLVSLISAAILRDPRILPARRPG